MAKAIGFLIACYLMWCVYCLMELVNYIGQ